MFCERDTAVKSLKNLNHKERVMQQPVTGVCTTCHRSVTRIVSLL